MTRQQLHRFRLKLLQQKQQIGELESTLAASSETVVLDQSRVGRLSRMDAMQGQQMALEASRRRRQQLANIERALILIAQGEYGYCAECGEEIDLRRLEFDPSSSLCINCAD